MSKVNIPPEVFDLLNIAFEGRLEDCSIESDGGNKKGEGFLGEILYFTIANKQRKDRKVIVKQIKANLGPLAPLVINAFKNEINFYSIIWPRLQEFMKTVALKYDKVPRCLATTKKSCDDLAQKIVLENLSSSNFSVTDKMKSFDKEYYEKIFESYGIFHGISMAFRELHREEFDNLMRPVTNEWKTMSFQERVLKMLKDQIRSIIPYFEESETVVINKLEIFEDRMLPINVEVFSCEDDNTILCHGDCWSNNFMFSYDDSGAISDMRLLDFQMILRGPPIYDLSYCLYSGGSKEIYDQLDYYLKIYYDNLSTTLTQFGCDANEVYSFATLKKEWKKYCAFGFLRGISMWRAKLMKSDDVKDLSEMKDGPDKYFKLSNDRMDLHKQMIRELVYHMSDNDYI